ncbi:MAG: holo-ACP synthase, partial [Spirochaetota bacterium]
MIEAMIVGHGIDVMSVQRIENAIKRHQEHFLSRVYTNYEREYCWRRNKTAYQVFASFWAAKEAAMKALGTGNRKGVRFKDIE